MFLLGRSLTQRHVEPMVRGTEGGVVSAKCVRYLCALLLCASFLVLGCEKEPKDVNPSLHGTWVSAYGEEYIIDLDNSIFDCPSTSFPDYAYKGQISEVVYFNADGTAGIIYIELTEKGNGFTTSGTGNFTGVHFINLTDTKVEISAAVDENYATPVKETLAQAKQLLNVDSVQTYFAMTSACVKQ